MPTGIYNRAESNWVPWNRGIRGVVKASEETRAKLSAMRMGHRSYTLGMKFSTETLLRMSNAQKAIGNRPPSMKGKKHSPEAIARMCEAQKKRCAGKDRRGANALNWKGGIAIKNRKVRDSTATRKWRKSVLDRDHHICQHCLKVGGKLQAHHIKEFALYPELRFELDNGLTLCKPCHLKHHFGVERSSPAQVQAT